MRPAADFSRSAIGDSGRRMATSRLTVMDSQPASRRDAWWIQTIAVILGLGGFSVYATFRAFEGAFFQWGPYLSPFYSPLIDVHHRYWPYSPALLILGGPLGFRATC